MIVVQKLQAELLHEQSKLLDPSYKQKKKRTCYLSMQEVHLCDRSHLLMKSSELHSRSPISECRVKEPHDSHTR